jgi:hypothetical protein
VTANGPHQCLESRIWQVVVLCRKRISIRGSRRARFFGRGALWLEDEWELPPDDAAVLVGIAADCGVWRVSNTLHTASGTISRYLLPPG